MLPLLNTIIQTFFPKPKNATELVAGGVVSVAPSPSAPSPTPPSPAPVVPPAPPPAPEVPVDPTVFPNTSSRYAGNYDREIVLDMIDCLQKPPPQVTHDYINIVYRVASFLGRPPPTPLDALLRETGAQTVWLDPAFPEMHVFGNVIRNPRRPMTIGPGPDAQEKLRNEANRGRNDVYDVINRVNAFVARAKNAGFVPPENPFSLAMTYNVGRVGFTSVDLPNDQATRIAGNVRSYLRLLQAETSGQLNLDQNVMRAAQLSSAKLSLEGFGGTGNTAVDLAKLLPDADEVKLQKAAEALSVFDFTKRVPRVLFTAFYAPDGVPKGVLIGWKKVADASGYVIRRRAVFDGRETQYSMTNDQVKASSARLDEYVRAWVLSFYDNVRPELVWTFMDADVPPHGYFTYRVQAYQLQNEVPGTMFAVETEPVFIPTAQKIQIRDQIELLDPSFRNARRGLFGRNSRNVSDVDVTETISPYPVLANFLLGDSKYDWLLAAINIRSSVNRGDTRTTTRGYSYLAAQLNFLFAQADAGKLVVPKGRDVSKVLNNVTDAISKFGVNQVLKEVLQETGALYHFEGKDPSDNAIFRSVSSNDPSDSSLISVVAAAIDPETATLNLKTLSTNLPKLLTGEFVSVNDRLESTREGGPKKVAQPSEVALPSEFDRPQDARAEDEVQFLQSLDTLSEGSVDLTTVDGIATFMRTVRVFSDIGPNRGTPVVASSAVLVPDPVTVPPPPAPPPGVPSAAQPVTEPFIEAGETDEDRARLAAEAARKRAQESLDKANLDLAVLNATVKFGGKNGGSTF